ncbi:MAG: LysE family translocator [Candidatus Bathyarchaeota archaeon]|nr:LysE family translocator [Candidatus Bathyarchaeota archaeon]
MEPTIGGFQIEYITNFYLFLISVVLISFSGVLLPGPLFAVTMEKAAKRKSAGVLIALGHGAVEVPMIFLIYFWFSQFDIPDFVSIFVGIAGGLLMMYMGINAFKNKDKKIQYDISHSDSFLSGIWTTAANAGFILWWLTIGTTLVLNAKIFGIFGFSVFTIVHWLCDFAWYSVIAFLIFKSRRFWNKSVHNAIFLFCFLVFFGFGAWFFSSALLSLISIL